MVDFLVRINQLQRPPESYSNLEFFKLHFWTKFSQTKFIDIWKWLSFIALHGCFPVESSNYVTVDAPS